MMQSPHQSTGGALSSQHAPPLDLPFRFFATALVGFLTLAVLSPVETEQALHSFTDPHLVALVHLQTLGIIVTTIFGATYQLLPVVLQVPLASVRLARLTWWLLVPGVAAFLTGLLGGWLPALATGGTLLILSLWLYTGIVVATLVRAPHRDVVFWHIAIAVAGLAVAALLGFLLALTLTWGLFGGRIFAVLAAHVVLMLGAWVTPLIIGVAYRLVGMFTLSEDHFHPGWAWGELGLVSVGAWILAAGVLFQLPAPLDLAASIAMLLGLGLFALQLLNLYRGRRRRKLDIHVPFIVLATVWAGLATVLLAIGVTTGRAPDDPLWRLVGWLAIAGWAETAIQGFFYKIGAFLTWLHRYAPLAGRQRVPRLEQLYDVRIALLGWAAWTIAITVEAAAIVLQAPALAVGAGVASALGLLALLTNATHIGMHWIGRQTPAVRQPRAERLL